MFLNDFGRLTIIFASADQIVREWCVKSLTKQCEVIVRDLMSSVWSLILCVWARLLYACVVLAGWLSESERLVKDKTTAKEGLTEWKTGLVVCWWRWEYRPVSSWFSHSSTGFAHEFQKNRSIHLHGCVGMNMVNSHQMRLVLWQRLYNDAMRNADKSKIAQQLSPLLDGAKWCPAVQSHSNW